MAKHRTNALVDAAVAAGARPATEEEYAAEEGKTSLVFHLPATSPKKKAKLKKKS